MEKGGSWKGCEEGDRRREGVGRGVRKVIGEGREWERGSREGDRRREGVGRGCK